MHPTIRLAGIELNNENQSQWDTGANHETYTVQPLLLIFFFLANRSEEAHPRENQVRAEVLP